MPSTPSKKKLQIPLDIHIGGDIVVSMKDTDTLTINPSHKITVERIKDLLCNAIEGGSGYWIKTLDRMGGIDCEQARYRQDVPFVEGGWLELVELNEEWQNATAFKYRIDLEVIKTGLTIFAAKYPRHFADFIAENDDADTGDIFLQCCCFGEAIYG